MSMIKLCPVCGSGHLTRQSTIESITYKGFTESYAHLFSVCDICHVDQVDAEEMRANKRSVIRLKKVIDGLLTGDEMKAIRTSWRISQDDASRIFGGGPKAFSKYENDDVAQSESMDKLIRTANKFPQVFSDLCSAAGVTPLTAIATTITVKRTVFTWSGSAETMSAQPDIVENFH
ncbi:type II toxin-antitoxin system MqsA family antitoxin [Pseudocitrobacter sp. MW920760]|uniref:type II toxin-antitoxin system MqsA family antitoxin n=1 Tax=Pseudocitrobacter sp. MW920760 TaxID=2981140 RepID=UPI002E17D7B6|nr:type II toxin-antitoxin system MqsA family antitoxin [Pseudocitrobacter sp. MW920760]